MVDPVRCICTSCDPTRFGRPAMVMSLLHDQLHRLFPDALWRGDPTRREIALTFDDGPHVEATPALLALLDHYEIPATFFQVGDRAAAAPHLVQQVAAAGHQIGLHGYQHQSFLFKNSQTLRRELANAQTVLADASGREPAAFNAVRPPFGHFTPATLNTLVAASYLPTMWSLVPFHWMQSAETTVRQVIDDVHNGAILVLHEGLSGPPVAELTQAILPHLVADGYRFVTIHEMWANTEQHAP
jgi:peptidoglycan/xylan/chitin deacetylase (PgdA/CDA1 family)